MENITHMGDVLEAYLFRLLNGIALRLNVEKPEREQVRENMKEAFFALFFAFLIVILLNLAIVQIMIKL